MTRKKPTRTTSKAPKRTSEPPKKRGPKPKPKPRNPERPADAEVGSRAWYEWRVACVEAELETATGAPAAALERRVLQYADKIRELRREEEQAAKLTHEELLAALASDAAEMPDVYLEPFVREFCQRNRLQLVRPPDGTARLVEA